MLLTKFIDTVALKNNSKIMYVDENMTHIHCIELKKLRF